MLRLRMAALVLIALTAGAAIAYSRVVRTVLLPGLLQYAPKEAPIIVATGDMASLWHAVDRGFGTAIRDRAHPGYLGGFLADLQSELGTKGVSVTTLDAVTAEGIDTTRGALVAIERGGDALVAAVPVSNPQAFERLLSKLFGPPAQASVSLGSPSEPRATRYGSWLVLFPEPGVAVVSNSVSTLRRSVLQRSQNLAHARSNDALFESVRHHVQGKLLSGPGLFVFFNPNGYGPLRRAAGFVHLHRNAIDLVADIWLNTGGLRSLTDLFLARRDAETILAGESTSVPVAAVFRHPTLVRSAGLLFSSPSANDPWTQLLRGLSGKANLTEVSLAMRRYREGLPDVVAGVKASPQTLGALVRQTQRQLRHRRDGLILREAVKRACEAGKAERCAPTVRDLEAQGFLSPRDRPILERYILPAATPAPNSMTDDFFSGPEYRDRVRDVDVEYLAPRLTESDRRLRRDLATVSDEDLARNRYRLATVRAGDVLWIATDAGDLPPAAGPAGPQRDLWTRVAEQEPGAPWRGTDVLRLVVNIERAIAIGMLSGDAAAEDLVKRLLLDVRRYGLLTLATTPVDDQERLRVTVRATPRIVR